MRIIGGKYRGTKLIAPKTKGVRPTSDKARGIIFNILSHRWRALLHHAIVLDAYAGTGALGLEALSRGASYAYFVDRSEEALACIAYNRLRCHADEKSVVIKGDMRVITLPRQATLVFLDPPYADNPMAILTTINHNWTGDALIILEMSMDSPWQCPKNYIEVDTRHAGKTILRFLKQTTTENSQEYDQQYDAKLLAPAHD